MPKLSLPTCILAIAICSTTVFGQHFSLNQRQKGLAQAKASHPIKTAAIKVTAYPENYLDASQQPAVSSTSVQGGHLSNLWVLMGFGALLGVGAAITHFSIAGRKRHRAPHPIAMPNKHRSGAQEPA